MKMHRINRTIENDIGANKNGNIGKNPANNEAINAFNGFNSSGATLGNNGV